MTLLRAAHGGPVPGGVARIAIAGRPVTGLRAGGTPDAAGRPVPIRLPAGTVVPVAPGDGGPGGAGWSRPVGGTDESSPLLCLYSLLVATFLGTMGLPHILVRFYTNPDGHAARRTTVRVLTLLGLFYAFPAVYGALGRA